MSEPILAERRFGATLLAPDLTRFRLWAPDCQAVVVEIVGLPDVAMVPLKDGWFEAECACGAGAQYRFRISDSLAVPDPASRAQAFDVHDRSVVVDPAAYAWQHPHWRGRPWHEAVIYELHVGALGGFAGVIAFLPHLVALGVTVVELMPVADFPGQCNWGYDGVLPFAPDAAYGTPDDLKHLVDTAHGLGLMVMLDVVYNHFGPDGNYLGAYASAFYRHDRRTPWGDGFDFRRPQVRQFFTENAIYWLSEYRFDGLRFDAVHAMADKPFLLALAQAIRAEVEQERCVHLVLENENQDLDLLRTHERSEGFDAQWADDLHHCLHVLLSGEDEAYYEKFTDRPAQCLATCLATGFAFPGKAATEAAGQMPMSAFVTCLQNHDQIGNRALGERLHSLAHPDALRAATVLLLLAPQIPLLFMGQEWAATTPFLFFADHKPTLAKAVREGRHAEFAGFAAFVDEAAQERIPDPNDPRTFQMSKPDLSELNLPTHAPWLTLYRDLLSIRGSKLMPHLQVARALGATVLGPAAVRAQWQLAHGRRLTIAINLGDAAVGCPAPEGELLFALGTRAWPLMLPGQAAEASLMVGVA